MSFLKPSLQKVDDHSSSDNKFQTVWPVTTKIPLMVRLSSQQDGNSGPVAATTVSRQWHLRR